VKKNKILFSLLSVVLLSFVGCFQSPDEDVSVEKLDKVAIVRSGSSQSNGTMMQYFHWYSEGYNTGTEKGLWTEVSEEASQLAENGITALWLPPAYKGGSAYDVGYGVYDMYDLGEFDQKGSVPTKYGTKDQYLEAVSDAHASGLQVYGDVVFNHRGNADNTEAFYVKKVDPNNRNVELHSNAYEIEGWTGFDFPGRNNVYSNFKWHWYHFDGVDWDDRYKESAIFKIASEGKAWDETVSNQNGNYDYLMYADLDMDHPAVKQELKDWGEWYADFTGVDGFRMDAVKHIKYQYLQEWVEHMRWATGKEMFTVGEYWSYDLGDLTSFMNTTQQSMSLFDAPLHMNFYNASKSGGSYDMRNLMNNTLMQVNPGKAVTIVENHDTQPLQSLESTVDWWFKPLAYSFILLREEGYPCVFYADYYGAQYSENGYNINMAQVSGIEKLVKARKDFAYGTQHSYMDHWDVIGWTREGDNYHPSGLATLMSDGAGGSKWMNVGSRNAGETYYDYTGNRSDTVVINSDGWGEFKCNGGSVSVWVEQ